MKVAIYARVSTNDQSTDMQVQDLIKHCQIRGFTIYKIYRDQGISGSIKSRPSLDELMKDAHKGKFKAVLVWRFDRFARSTKHLITALEEFRNIGVDFISHNENIDTSSAVGEMIFTMISAMAQFERRLIQERVVAGLRNAKAKGKKLGRKVVINQDQIKILRSQDKSMHQIAKELDISVGSVFRALKA
jgi:DNA invertase Pin-like site-specific DNA recombinase